MVSGSNSPATKKEAMSPGRPSKSSVTAKSKGSEQSVTDDGVAVKKRRQAKQQVDEDGDGLLAKTSGEMSGTQEAEHQEEQSETKNKSKKRKSSKKISDKENDPSEKSFLSSLCSKAKYILLLIFVPPFLNYASLQREGVELKPPGGELYDIGWGQRLFLSCQGQGPPTVVLDAPTGMSSDVWAVVVEQLAKHAAVCVYDRAGLGFSERPFNRSGLNIQETVEKGNMNPPEDRRIPFTAERMVDDLHALITTSSQQSRPLIFVGAELGAIVSQFYAQMFESDILGLVLVNPLPDQLMGDGPWAQHWFNQLTPTYQTLQLGAALGVNRLGLLVGAIKQPITGDLVTPEVVMRQKYLLCHPRHMSSVVDEHYFINETLSQLRTLRMIKPLASNISVSILTGNYYDEQMPSHLNKAWARAEQSLLSRHYPNSQHLVVNGADRHMMYRKPEPIVEAVLKVIRWWRRSSHHYQAKGSQSS